MPRSRRVRDTPLTQTDRRSTKAHKTAFIQDVRDAMDAYTTMYVVSFHNMRASQLKNVRMQLRDTSRVVMGKQTLLQLALGRTAEEEYADNLRHVAKHCTKGGGDRGLILTNASEKEIKSYFDTLDEPDFARAGHIVQGDEDIVIEAKQLTGFPSSMVEPLRKLGLPVDLKNGVLVLQGGQESFRLCKAGETLTVEKCKLLTHFDIKLANFRVTLECQWSKGQYTPLM